MGRDRQVMMAVELDCSGDGYRAVVLCCFGSSSSLCLFLFSVRCCLVPEFLIEEPCVPPFCSRLFCPEFWLYHLQFENVQVSSPRAFCVCLLFCRDDTVVRIFHAAVIHPDLPCTVLALPINRTTELLFRFVLLFLLPD